MRFNVVIATHGRSDLLARTLRSLAQCPRPEGFEHVLVVENGTPHGAQETCQELADRLPVQYHHVKPAGKNRAIQHALEGLQDGFVLFLDDDIRVCDELLERYAQAVAQHGANAVYGGPDPTRIRVPPPAVAGRPPAPVGPWLRAQGPSKHPLRGLVYRHQLRGVC